jgi:type III polyketide synthase
MNQELTKSLGMIATITERVPKTAIDAILPIFDHLTADSTPADFDWAIHPGGAAILHGAQRSLNLSDDHIRASLKVYRSHGNSSSPTVLIVLDELRRMEKGRDNVVATSFGPGMTIEMCMMKRCRTGDLEVEASEESSFFGGATGSIRETEEMVCCSHCSCGVKRIIGVSFALDTVHNNTVFRTG